jgi:hypothetical protein
LDTIVRSRFVDETLEALIHPAFARLEVTDAGISTRAITVVRIHD